MHATHREGVRQFDSRHPVLTVVELEAVQTLSLQSDQNVELWREMKCSMHTYS